MKRFFLIGAIAITTTVFAAPENFTFKGDVKIAGKLANKKGEVKEKDNKEAVPEKAKASPAGAETTQEVAAVPAELKWQNGDEANMESVLMADYKQELGWAGGKVKLVGGTEKEFSDVVNIQKVLIGRNFYEDGAIRWYGEIGRQQLSDHFESAVQFTSYFDGIYTEYNRPVAALGTYVVQGGPMVADEFDAKHYGRGYGKNLGWVAMTGFDDIGGTGAYTKISMARWRASRQPIQLLAGYRFKERGIFPSGRVYGAYIINPAAKNNRAAGYIGAQLGNIQKQGDWSVKAEMRVVEAKALYKQDATGTNFYGPLAEVGYAFTDNVSAKLKVQHSNRINRNYEGDQSDTQLEGKLIVTF